MSELRWAGVAGVLFAVLFVFAVTTAGDAPGGDEDSDAAVTAYYEDSDNRGMLITVAYLLVASALALVVFSRVGPYSLMRDSADSLTRHCAALGMTGAVLAAAGISLGGMALAAVSGGVTFQDEPVDPGVARFMVHLGYGSILIWGGLAGAFSIASFALGALRSGAMARWLAWLGFAAAAALLFAVLFIPMVALPLWVLVASVVFFLKERTVAQGAAPAVG